jgi:hypothetical protein
MHPLLDQVLNQAGYDELPEAIKHSYSQKEFLWLSDAEKATLVQRETEPEHDEP